MHGRPPEVHEEVPWRASAAAREATAIVVVCPHWNSFLPETLGEADVVGVTVGQDECIDVVDRAAEVVQVVHLLPVRREPGIDDSQPVAVPDDVPVDLVGSEAVHAGSDLPVVCVDGFGFRAHTV